MIDAGKIGNRLWSSTPAKQPPFFFHPQLLLHPRSWLLQSIDCWRTHTQLQRGAEERDTIFWSFLHSLWILCSYSCEFKLRAFPLCVRLAHFGSAPARCVHYGDSIYDEESSPRGALVRHHHCIWGLKFHDWLIAFHASWPKSFFNAPWALNMHWACLTQHVDIGGVHLLSRGQRLTCHELGWLSRGSSSSSHATHPWIWPP